MKRKAVSGIMLTLLLIGMLTLAFNIQPVRASGTIYIGADGSIDPPTTPITTVDNVTYTFTGNIYDQIVVQRSNITIDGKGYTLQGSGDGGGFNFQYIANVTIRNANIKGFSVGLSVEWSSHLNFSDNLVTNNVWYGIDLYSSSNNIISRNNIINNGGGVWLEGSNNTVSENYITNNNVGVLLQSSNNNTFLGNTITNNTMNGVSLLISSYNLFRNNIMAGNLYNFEVFGWELSHFIHDVDSSNTIEGKPIYYWINRQNEDAPSDAGYIALVNSNNITVKGLELKNNGEGVLLANTSNSQIINNNITDNKCGVRLYQSSNNNISGNTITNTITNNHDIGAVLYSSSNNNIISENTITNNKDGGLVVYGYSNNNTIFGNTIAYNGDGISLGSTGASSNNNIIFENTIVYNEVDGVCLSGGSSYNIIYENTITGNGNDGIRITWGSSQNNISKNIITSNSHCGVYLDAPFNNIATNTITDNVYSGIALQDAAYNNVFKNTIMNSYDGLYIFSTEYGVSHDNFIFENTIAYQQRYGIVLDASSNNKIYHNNFLYPYVLISGSVNAWDDNYPSGGNYWSDYTGVDEKSGPNQNQTGSDGIGDSAYVMDADNRDRYPFMSPYEIVTPTTIDDYDGLWHNNDFTITLEAIDIGSGVAETCYKINNGPTKTVSADGQPLITTEGANNTLEYWSVDKAGNEELPHKILTGIKLDKASPTGSVIINNGDTYTTSTSVTLTLTANDAISGVYQVRYSNDGVWDTEPWEALTPTKTWTLTLGDGTKTVYYQIKDHAELISTYSDTIILDTIQPAGAITIAGDLAYTNSTSVTLTLSADDAASGVAQMRFSNDNTTWTTWEPYSPSKSWALTTGDGTKTVYVQYMDNAGQISPSYSDSITLDITKPTANAGADQTVNEHTMVTLNASASQDENGIASYTWTFTDVTPQTLTGKNPTYTFITPGTYTITLRVTDPAGNTATDQITITVEALPTEGFPLWIAGAAIATIAIATAAIVVFLRKRK